MKMNIGLITIILAVSFSIAPVASAAKAPLKKAAPTVAACTLKGNISSSHEKIYHVKGCASDNATSIETAKGERWFCSETEAKAAGWRKAKNC